MEAVAVFITIFTMELNALNADLTVLAAKMSQFAIYVTKVTSTFMTAAAAVLMGISNMN